MESATHSVVAAAASAIPFHCIICFDEFNLTDKPPVVLPCGHTYLCEPCSKRIKVCMECRTPLYWTPPRAVMPLKTHNLNPRYGGNRYSSVPQAAPHSPMKAPEPISLPIPKNVVLLAMMEAAERQAMMTGGSVLDMSADDMEDEHVQTNDDDENHELKRIVAGVQAISGPCGTYAVREDEGLAVLPQDPRKRSQVRDPDETREPFMVEKGQMVQVVDVIDGVVKLARGCGYVVASDCQLVKVGGPLDRSCQVEGTLKMMELRKTELKRQLEQTERLTEFLAAELKDLEAQEPTHPIITEPPPTFQEQHSPNQVSSCPGTPVTYKVESSVPQSPTVITSGVHGVELTENTSPITPGDPISPGRSQPQSPPVLGSPYSIDNADLNSGVYTSRTGGRDHQAMSLYRAEEDGPGLVHFGCSSLLFGRVCESDDEDVVDGRLIGLSFDSDNSNSPNTPGSPILTCTPSLGSMGPPAAPRHTLASPQRTSSFDTIDFRTGMSGHRALLSTRTADPRSVPAARSAIRMMSDHKGISKIRPLHHK